MTGSENAILRMVLFRLLSHHSGTAIGKTAMHTSIRTNGIKLQSGRHNAGDGIPDRSSHEIGCALCRGRSPHVTRFGLMLISTALPEARDGSASINHCAQLGLSSKG